MDPTFQHDHTDLVTMMRIYVHRQIVLSFAMIDDNQFIVIETPYEAHIVVPDITVALVEYRPPQRVVQDSFCHVHVETSIWRDGGLSCLGVYQDNAQFEPDTIQVYMHVGLTIKMRSVAVAKATPRPTLFS